MDLSNNNIVPYYIYMFTLCIGPFFDLLTLVNSEQTLADSECFLLRLPRNARPQATKDSGHLIDKDTSLSKV